MVDTRHAPDTLFFVCEEDWRLYPSDERVTSDAVAAAIYEASAGTGSRFQTGLNAGGEIPRVRLGRAFNPDSGEPFAPEEGSGDGATADDAGVAPRSEGWEEICAGFYQRAGKPGRGSDVDSLAPSQEIQDLVKICTVAARSDCGNLIWLSWNGRSTRGGRCKPSFGAQMIAVTLKGARKLLMAGARMELPPSHWDICLKNWLNTPGRAESIGAAYVYPAIGNYKEHRSGIEKNYVRPGRWDENWCQAGTRQSDGEGFQHRYLCRWLEKSRGVDWTAKITLPEKYEGVLSWKTLRPQEDEYARQEHEMRRKVYGAPALLTETAAPWETFAAELGTDADQPMTKRAKRQLRSNRAYYSKRIFVDDAVEAPLQKRQCIYTRIYICSEPFALHVFLDFKSKTRVSLSPPLWFVRVNICLRI